ncbi:cytochrome c oxidase assembly protein COX11, mitochondrial-like [Brassica napus]|uniref:cytochrome c oxidase assembly protein COX11, mitochondrial-like n=1 Tax=Brassica napus TaxID=3708 RepID=UPI0020799706|nr:cytochrome c oxidase assembly protein COX11, mitochondrial-like [Brassica napus]
MPLAQYSRYYYTHGACKGNQHSLRSKIGLWGSPSSFLYLNSHSSMILGGAHRQYYTQSITETKSKKMLYYLTAVVFGMVGLTYAAVPLYRTFCQATGYGVAYYSSVSKNREIVVQFNADVADGMQWKFTPTQREV